MDDPDRPDRPEGSDGTAQADRTDDSAVTLVSDAIAERRRQGTALDRVRDVWTWVLVDADRGVLIAGLAVLVYAVTVGVGVLGPWTQRQYALGGTPIADAYIELQPGVLTVMTIVLTINQLVLAPEIGPVSRERRRLEDVLAHRIQIENVAGTGTSPMEPAAFLETVTAAAKRRATALGNAVADASDPDLRDDVGAYATAVIEGADRVGDALADQAFGRVEIVGATLHFDAARNLHRVRELHDEYEDALSVVQRKAFTDAADALELYTISQQYFQTLYVRAEFVRFSRAILYTGLPALAVAHYGVGIIGPGVLPGSTFGVRNLLWFEAGTFTLAVSPALVLVSYAARLVTLAETSIFIGPFVPGRASRDGDRGNRPGRRREQAERD